MYSKEQLDEAIKLAVRESNHQLLNWFLKVLGEGLPGGMVRAVIHKKIEEVKK